MRRALLLLAAFATLSAAPPALARKAEPQVVIEVRPLNDRARFYAACIDAAIQGPGLERTVRYLRFTCSGPPAQALFDALDVFARTRASQHPEPAPPGREVRHIGSVAWDDQCWLEAGPPPAYGCTLYLPVGDFLDPENDATLPNR